MASIENKTTPTGGNVDASTTAGALLSAQMKTALNMTTMWYGKAFPAMRINAVAPGFSKAALNAGTGRRSVDRGARIIVRMTQIASPLVRRGDLGRC